MQITIVLKNDAENLFEATHVFDEFLITIGSDPAANVFLDDARAAPEQAVIVNENEQPIFINQTKGTLYNDFEIAKGARREVQRGDEIKIGNFHLAIDFNSVNGSQTQPAINSNFSESGNATNGATDFAAEKTAPEKTDIRSFADILSSLRNEEDQFYFQIVGDNGQQKERVPVNLQETYLGWNVEDNALTTNREIITEPRAVIRKDWSGVTIYPQGKEEILINNSLLEAGQRLKNGDQLVFTRKLTPTTNEEIKLVFCEPAALLELNSILPQELLNTALETNLTPGQQPNNGQRTVGAAAKNGRLPDVASNAETEDNRRYFGYFTAIEILIMFFATILTAALTFVLLEFS